MSVTAQRVLYGLLTALGFALTVPLAVTYRQLSSLAIDPIALQESGELGELYRVTLLALAGLALVTGFLYAALSVGYPRAWRPARGSVTLCARCSAEIGPSVDRCPVCDQQFSR